MRTWNRRAALRVLGGTALGGSTLLAACGGNSEASGGARLRLLNASNGYASLDLTVGDAGAGSAIGFGQAGAYADADTRGVTTVVSAHGSGTALASATRTLARDTAYTLVAYGWAGALKTALIEENLDAASSGKARLQVMNLAADAGTLDVYLTGADEPLDSATPLASSVAGGATASAVTLNAGSYRLRVTAAGDRSDLRLDVTGLALASIEVATLLLVPGSGGVLVQAVLARQQGSVEAQANPLARLRVLASLADGGRVTCTVGGTVVTSNATSPAIGNYALVTGGQPLVNLLVDGRALAVPATALPAGGDYTLLVWGDAAAPQLTWISDDNRLPADTARAKVRLVHAVTDLATPVTLTVNSALLANLSNVARGTASSAVQIAPATGATVEVFAGTSAAAVYAKTDALFVAKGLYTVYLLGSTAAPLFRTLQDR